MEWNCTSKDWFKERVLQKGFDWVVRDVADYMGMEREFINSLKVKVMDCGFALGVACQRPNGERRGLCLKLPGDLAMNVTPIKEMLNKLSDEYKGE